ncbi:DedA family protein [Acuticoccus sediminis]|uniref:DedA family protein n=1 Tax=Acuticoccus sediminis TaxID=2184697 RepID=UPI002467FFE6|nr:DedA family protein [Acuticoccus sediminis]
MALIERLVPVLPSYAVLVVIGIAAAEGHFSLPAALLLSTVGTVLGCLPLYALGEARARNLLERFGRYIGVPSSRTGWWLDQFRSNGHRFVLCAQLIPTIRLIAPGISGLLRARSWRFVGATSLGAALWNALFIAVGYAAARDGGDANASALALKTWLILIGVEALVAGIWRIRARRPSTVTPDPETSVYRRTRPERSDPRIPAGDDVVPERVRSVHRPGRP